MIYGETTLILGGVTVSLINTRWFPGERPLWRVYGMTQDGTCVDVYVFDDCCDDAICSALEWIDELWSDDRGLSVHRVTGVHYERCCTEAALCYNEE